MKNYTFQFIGAGIGLVIAILLLKFLPALVNIVFTIAMAGLGFFIAKRNAPDWIKKIKE